MALTRRTNVSENFNMEDIAVNDFEKELGELALKKQRSVIERKRKLKLLLEKAKNEGVEQGKRQQRIEDQKIFDTSVNSIKKSFKQVSDSISSADDESAKALGRQIKNIQKKYEAIIAEKDRMYAEEKKTILAEARERDKQKDIEHRLDKKNIIDHHKKQIAMEKKRADDKIKESEDLDKKLKLDASKKEHERRREHEGLRLELVEEKQLWHDENERLKDILNRIIQQMLVVNDRVRIILTQGNMISGADQKSIEYIMNELKDNEQRVEKKGPKATKRRTRMPLLGIDGNSSEVL